MGIRLEQGDITRVAADVIVNAANSQLAGGGGVDGAIHRAAGLSVMTELNVIRREIGHCASGQAVVTGAGKLQARYIVHAVGPIYRDGRSGESDLLASCYREALRLAAARGAKSIAFPAISAGVYGYPLQEAADIAIRETREYLSQSDSIEDVLFVLYTAEAFEAFRRALLT